MKPYCTSSSARSSEDSVSWKRACSCLFILSSILRTIVTCKARWWKWSIEKQNHNSLHNETVKSILAFLKQDRRYHLSNVKYLCLWNVKSNSNLKVFLLLPDLALHVDHMSVLRVGWLRSLRLHRLCDLRWHCSGSAVWGVWQLYKGCQWIYSISADTTSCNVTSGNYRPVKILIQKQKYCNTYFTSSKNFSSSNVFACEALPKKKIWSFSTA